MWCLSPKWSSNHFDTVSPLTQALSPAPWLVSSFSKLRGQKYRSVCGIPWRCDRFNLVWSTRNSFANRKYCFNLFLWYRNLPVKIGGWRAVFQIWWVFSCIQFVLSIGHSRKNYMASLVAQIVKNLPAMWETLGSIPGSERTPGEGNIYMDWACTHRHTHTPPHTHTHVCAQSLQLCLTLCDPMHYNPPGSSVHEILQARTLE